MLSLKDSKYQKVWKGGNCYLESITYQSNVCTGADPSSSDQFYQWWRLSCVQQDQLGLSADTSHPSKVFNIHQWDANLDSWLSS